LRIVAAPVAIDSLPQKATGRATASVVIALRDEQQGAALASTA
jgi:hypothetical protein